MKKYLILFVATMFLVACGEDSSNVVVESEVTEEIEEVSEETEVNLTESEKMTERIIELMEEDLAFDSGEYAKGDIPKGEYAFVRFEGSGSYYSEVDGSGSIIDNENFDSFGYVQVHEVGDIENNGVLINVNAFDKLDVKGAKEIFEVLNDITDYQESGYYKVGLDIDPGEYFIESYGSGYIGVMSGPVGNGEIIENDNFSGDYTVTLKKGQYLTLSKAYISE